MLTPAHPATWPGIGYLIEADIIISQDSATIPPT
jgi:hypothetical protein